MMSINVNPSKLPPLKVPTVVDVTVDYFENLIVSGILLPNAVLPSERKLAEALDISRVCLRTAIAKLAAKGLIITEGRTTRVANIFSTLLASHSQQTPPLKLKDVFESWRFFLLVGASLAAARHTQHDADEIRHLQESFSQAVADRNPEAAALDFLSWARQICAASTNFILAQVFLALSEGLHDTVLAIFKNHAQGKGPLGWRDGVEEVTNALLAKDPHETRKLAKNLLAKINIEEDGRFSFESGLNGMPPAGLAKVMRIALNYIEKQGYAVGDTLPPAEQIADASHIPLTSLREAIAALDALGVVSIGKREKVTLVSLDAPDASTPLLALILDKPQAVYQVYEFREIVEGHICHLAAQKPVAKKTIEGLRSRLEAALKGKQSGYAEADAEFHSTLARLSGDETLARITETLMPIFIKVTREWFLQPYDSDSNLLNIHAQHGRILDALEQQNPQTAALEMADHLSYVTRTIKLGEDRGRQETIASMRTKLAEL